MEKRGDMAGSQHALEIAARLITARAAPEQVLDAVLNAALDATRATQALIALVDSMQHALAPQVGARIRLAVIHAQAR